MSWNAAVRRKPAQNKQKQITMSIYHTPPNTFRITQLWAVLSSDEGGEGLCAGPVINGVMLPLIAADEARLESFMPMAHKIAKESGKKVKIVRFTVREEIMEINP